MTKGETTGELGTFEGFNFRTQGAIEKLLTADDVIEWDHNAKGEAEFWPSGDAPLVHQFFRGNCTGTELVELRRILEEFDGCTHELVKALYLHTDRGLKLEDISRNTIDDTCLYVFGPGNRFDLEKEVAYELFETFWPEAYKQWEANNVPGLHFDPSDFMEHFPTMSVRLEEGDYLVVDTE